MAKWLRITLAVLVVVAVVFGFEQYAAREPRYHGRPLRDWIQEGFRDKNPNPAGAREAVLACGTNAIPFYLKLLKIKRGPAFKDKLLEFLDRHDLPGFGLTHGDDAIAGLEVGSRGLAILGVEARPAVPTLMRILWNGDEDRAARAGYALARAGVDAIIISNFLSDPLAEKRARVASIARNYAVAGRLPLTPRPLADIENSARVLVPALVNQITQPNPKFGSSVGAALGEFARMPEIVLPIVISTITNTNDIWLEKSECIYFLKDYRPKARAAVPALLDAINDQSDWVRRTATMALKEIDETTGPEVIRRTAELILDVDRGAMQRIEIIKDLGNYGGKAAVATPALIELTRSGNDQFREPATIALAEIDPEAAIEAGVSLMIVFDGKDFPRWTNEIGAIRALGNLKRPAGEGIKCLLLALKSENPEIRREAALALKKIAPAEAAKAGVE